MKKVSLMIVAHRSIGSEMLAAVVPLFHPLPASVEVIEVPAGADINALTQEAIRAAQALDDHALLLLTDAFGSTPANIALNVLERHPEARLVSGLSLPMLIRVLNYAHLPLEQLAAKAISAGHEGIVHCRAPGNCHAE